MPKCCAKKLVYRYQPPAENGFRSRWWNASAGPHVDPATWSGPSDPVSGVPLPTAAAPDFDVVNNNANVNDSNSGAGNARYGFIDGWFFLPVAGFVRDNNGNTGELGMVLLGDCCGGGLVEAPGGNHTASTNGADSTLMDPTQLDAGWHYLANPSSDQSAFHGLQLQYSQDGTNDWENVAQKQPTIPLVETMEIASCRDVPDGWQVEPIYPCCQPKFQSTGGPAITPSQLTPIADNESDTDIRTGQAGATGEVSDAGHNHPIVRQANPGWPTITLSGPATENFSQNRIFRSTEEWVSFSFRKRFVTTTANGWVIYAIPGIAGFQTPEVFCQGVYYQTGDQDDTGKQVATMDGNGTVWADIGRIYYGQFSGKESAETWWPNILLRYVRA